MSKKREIKDYLQGIDSDQYLLRGIMNKQSSTNHVKFVRQLVQQAIRQG